MIRLENCVHSSIYYEKPLGIINFVRSRNFLKNQHFLPPDMQTYVCVSGGGGGMFVFRKSLANILNEWSPGSFYQLQLYEIIRLNESMIKLVNPIDVFKTLSNVCNEAFYILSINYFWKKIPSYIFDMVINTPFTLTSSICGRYYF